MKGEPLKVVLVADQQHSRTRPDRVPEALEALGTLAPSLLLPFERTAGDEVQGLLADAEAAVDCVETLTRLGEWRLGLGLGDVELPLPSSTREARGPAYVAAREAIERARSVPAGLAVVAVAPADADAARDAETLLLLLRTVWQRRTPQGWEVAALAGSGRSQTDIAAALGVTASAISQRARTAALDESARGRRLAADLLRRAVGGAR